MWWWACCLGNSLPIRFISDAKVVYRLARSFQSILCPQGGPEGTLEWIHSQTKPSPPPSKQAMSFSSSVSNHPPAHEAPLTPYTLENVIHSFTFLIWPNHCSSASMWSLLVTFSVSLFQSTAVKSQNTFSC